MVKNISMERKEMTLLEQHYVHGISLHVKKKIGFYPGTGEQHFILSSRAEFLDEIKRQRPAVTEL